MLGGYSRNSSVNSLVVLWLRLHAPSARDVGSIPGWGTKILHAIQRDQKVKKKKSSGKEVQEGGDICVPMANSC